MTEQKHELTPNIVVNNIQLYGLVTLRVLIGWHIRLGGIYCLRPNPFNDLRLCEHVGTNPGWVMFGVRVIQPPCSHWRNGIYITVLFIRPAITRFGIFPPR